MLWKAGNAIGERLYNGILRTPPSCQLSHRGVGVGRLDNRYLYLTVLGAERSKVRAPRDFMSGEGPFPGSMVTIFAVFFHALRERGTLSVSLV